MATKETPEEVADRIEAESRASAIPEDRDYGLMVDAVIRKDPRRKSK